MSEPTMNNNDPSQNPALNAGSLGNQTEVPPTAAAPAAPSTPVQATAQAQTTQPTAPVRPATPVAPEQPSPRGLHSAIFDGVLRTLGGGTQYITKTDPATGETTRVPIQQTRGQLGKSILAGAIAGMFGGMGARDKEGRHDPLKAAAEGFEVGGQPMEKKVGDLQKAEDESFARRQMTMKSNMDLVHQMAALTHQNHVDLQETADRNNAGVLKDAAEFDKNLAGADANDPTKKAVLGQHMTYQEALAKLNGHWSDQAAIVDGYQDIRLPNGAMEAQPTYALLNPNVTVKMSEDQAKEFGQYKPAYANAYQATGGNLAMPLGRYVQDVHELNSYKNAESYFERVKEDLGIQGAPDFKALASGKDGQQIRTAVKDMENAQAQGGDQVAVLKRLQGTGGGQLILKDMGISDEQVNKYVNEQVAAQREAQAVGDKAPADQAALAQIPILAKQMGLTPAEAATAAAELPATGATRADVAKVLENIRHQHDTNAQLAASANRDSGDPAMIERVARNLVDNPSSLTTMRDIGTRGTQRLAIIDKAEQIAKAEGKTFDTGLINQRVKFLEQYEDPKGKAAINRQAINNIVQHAADVSDLNQLNRRSNMKILNTPINALKDQFGDQVFTQYQTANGVLKDELGLYFAGGYSPTKDQQAMWEKIQANEATPAQTEAFAKEVVRLATRRADTFNEQFKTNMGYDDPNMLTPQAKSAAERLGLGDAVAHFKSGGQLGGQQTQNHNPPKPKMISVQIPGQKPGAISADKIDAFKKKYPNAIVGQGQ